MNQYAIIRVAEIEGVHRIIISSLASKRRPVRHMQIPVTKDVANQVMKALGMDLPEQPEFSFEMPSGVKLMKCSGRVAIQVDLESERKQDNDVNG